MVCNGSDISSWRLNGVFLFLENLGYKRLNNCIKKCVIYIIFFGVFIGIFKSVCK